MSLSAKDIARISLGCLEEKKAFDVKAYQVSSATIIADYFILASVDSHRQAYAIAASLRTEFKKHSILPLGIEGEKDSWWILIDFGDVVVHIFQREARVYYDLDSYWGDCPEVALDPIIPTEAA